MAKITARKPTNMHAAHMAKFRNCLHRLVNLTEEDGFTMKNGSLVNYPDGYQVATSGIESDNIFKAAAIMLQYHCNCGLWLSNGIYYVDKSHHVANRDEAIAIGRAHNQISILDWTDMSLIYLQEPAASAA